jgi:glycogen debranching enzyme
MNRRHFITVTGASALGGLGHAAGARQGPSSTDIEALFSSDNPELLQLARRVMEKCVLDKIRKPTPPLERTWIAPGGPHYVGQWIWDTMFVVDLLALLPEQKGVIRDVFHNYWDFQERWNETAPDYARDMITVAIKTAPQEPRQFSQIPILAWGLERVHERNGDLELVRRCLAPLEAWHEWYWRERDLHGNGLITLGAYTGKVQHARWETFDYECNMDGMKMTAHPHRQGADEGAWYADICVPGNNAYLILGERCLERLAKLVGDHEMAERRRKRIDRGVAGMREHLWDDEAGTFLSVKRDSLEKIPVATIGSWIPLTAGIPTAAMADRMAEVLASPKWQTPLPVPTVDRTDSRWKANAFWRGDVWPSPNYQIASGLAAYGHTKLAADIADKTIANALKNGLSEHYNSMTGEALGVPDYSMASTVLTMMLDGLSREHQLSLAD